MRYRRFFIVLLHLFLFAVSFVGAFILRFEFNFPKIFDERLAYCFFALLFTRTIIFQKYCLFHGLWRYSGVYEVWPLFRATTLSTSLLPVWVVLFQVEGFPRSIFVLDWLLCLFLVGGLRLGMRLLRESYAQRMSLNLKTKADNNADTHLLIVGAGDAGERLAREILRHPRQRNHYHIVGFLDDDEQKHQASIHGISVLGSIVRIKDKVIKYAVQEVVIAIPSASGDNMRRIYELCLQSGAKVRTIPSVDTLIQGQVELHHIRDIAIEDLLRRNPVLLNTEHLNHLIAGKVILVSGAGGSIGSELCRQICRFMPERVILLEHSECNLFYINKELQDSFNTCEFVPVIADVKDIERVEHCFKQHRPHVVFHAAAYKHVPMMELNESEAIRNNVFGTSIMAQAAHQYGARHFVLISTDKAVNPSSMMGASKRLAEILVQSLAQKSRTCFSVVRFGNVLDSTGSVIPIFKSQIKKGGPVTVTHPEMTRYFMTIPEASQLVLQAAAMGKGGEIFILDMGEPVKIVDLARDLIRLSGLNPDVDIDIVFTGIRPGEKLFEELSTSQEHMTHTAHDKIFVHHSPPMPWNHVMRILREIEMTLKSNHPQGLSLKQVLMRILPEYKPYQLIDTEKPEPKELTHMFEIPNVIDQSDKKHNRLF